MKHIKGTKWTYEEAKYFIEIESQSGCILVSEVFITSNDKLKVKCTCGDVFPVSLCCFRQGKRTCNKCSRERSIKAIAYSFEYVKNYVEVESNTGCKLISTEYIANNEPLVVQCKCGNIYNTSFQTFKKDKKHTCRECLKFKQTNWNFETVKQFVENNSDCIFVSTEYTKMVDKYDFICKCGLNFEALFSSFVFDNRRQCDLCSNITRWNYNTVSIYLSRLGYKLISTEYKNSYTSITIEDHNGYLYTPLLLNLRKGRNPKMVDKSNPFTIDNIKNWCKVNEKPFELISNTYINAKTPMRWRCLKENCGDIFETTWDIIIRDSECTQCLYYKGESKIKSVLKPFDVQYDTQFSFDDCKLINKLEFDFYLPDYITCVEYQGLQHYKPVDFAGKGQKWAENEFKKNQKRDNIKRKYCSDNNINLLEIPYWEYENIEEILKRELNL